MAATDDMRSGRAVHDIASPRARISFEELLRRLEDPYASPESVAPYLIVDPDASGPFSPVVVANPALVDLPAVEAAVFMAVLNGWSRRVRLKRYRERRESDPTAMQLVSEGDSWFQYPFLLRDVIDHLSLDHAVFCTAAAGDMLSDMIAQDEVVSALLAEKPAAILVSAGGNDLLGKIQTIIEPFDASREPGDYLAGTFDAFLQALVNDYRRFLLRLVPHLGGAHVFCHSYDYAIPRQGGRWLGRPMASVDIQDLTLQRTIVRLIVDRFHVALESVLDDPLLVDRVTLVDCRGAVPDDGWHDELHPTHEGYEIVADRFRDAIEHAFPDEPLESIREAAEAQPHPDQVSMTEAALFLSSRFEETALLHEIGRRIELTEADGGASPLGLTEVPSSSFEGVFDSFHGGGQALMRRIYRELSDMVCTDGVPRDDAAAGLAVAVESGRRVLAGYLVTFLGTAFTLPVAVATVAVAIVLRSVVTASLPAACAAWTTKAAE